MTSRITHYTTLIDMTVIEMRFLEQVPKLLKELLEEVKALREELAKTREEGE